MLGLSNAGKTTILYLLKTGEKVILDEVSKL